MSHNKPARFTALQNRDFRLLWLGQIVSVIGTQMQLIAINWHVYSLLQGQTWTISLIEGYTIDLNLGAAGLGFIGLVRVIPILFFGLWGGVLADTMERRKLMLWTETILASFAITLAVTTWLKWDSLWVIYGITSFTAAVGAISTTARQSLVPNLVPREHLTNAVSLTSLMFQIGTIVGPAVAGVLVSQFDLSLIYFLNALSFGAVIVALLLMKHRQIIPAATKKMTLHMIKEGLEATVSNRILFSTLLLDFFATFFSSARTMLPLVANEILGIGVQGYGLLATAEPIGSLLTGLVMSLRPEIKKQGQVLLASVAVYGLATALFGVSTYFWLSYILFAIVGAGDTISTVIRGTIRQVVTPDHLRGRVTSVSMLFFMSGPQLGELEAGFVAALWGVPFAIISGGIATVVMTGWVAWNYPRLRGYESHMMEAALKSSESVVVK